MGALPPNPQSATRLQPDPHRGVSGLRIANLGGAKKEAPAFGGLSPVVSVPDPATGPQLPSGFEGCASLAVGVCSVARFGDAVNVTGSTTILAQPTTKMANMTKEAAKKRTRATRQARHGGTGSHIRTRLTSRRYALHHAATCRSSDCAVSKQS